MVKLKANAKINLALEVMDTVNGYHMVNNIMIPISLADDITIEKSSDIVVKNCDIENNIMIKAAKLFFESYGITGGATITIDKHIPVAAGLAGGSTDAAFTLIGLNELYQVGASKNELKELASRLGSDVPFFIDNEVSLCTNRGEIVNKIDVSPFSFRLLIIKPNTGLSTALVYKNYEYKGISKESLIKDIIKALDEKNISLLDKSIFNDLEEVALGLNADLRSIYTELSKGYRVHVSGSGPSMFIINPSDEDILKIKAKYKDIFVGECVTF